MDTADIRWNDEARAKILDDSDRVLREAVLDVAKTHADGISDEAFAELHARLKDRFIDFEPGPDLRKYADAIVAGEFGSGDAAQGGAASGGATQGGSGSDASASPGSQTGADIDAGPRDPVAESGDEETTVNDG